MCAVCVFVCVSVSVSVSVSVCVCVCLPVKVVFSVLLYVTAVSLGSCVWPRLSAVVRGTGVCIVYVSCICL